MFELLALAATIGATAFGYLTARRFVRDRLKFVDAVQGWRGPIVAGIVAWAIAMPFTLLPLIGVGTAVLFGAAVGLGVRAGARDIRVGRLTTGQI